MSTTSKLDKALKESFAAVDYIREKCEAVTKIVKKYKLFDEKSTIDVLEAVFARVEEMKEQWDENKAYFERNEDYRLKFKPTAKAIIKMADVLRKCKFGGQQYRGSKQVAKLVDSIVLNSTPIHFVQNNGAPLIPGASEISPDEIQIDREIGQGSFGKVYLGLYNGATVALKFATTMPPEDFKREIKIMGKIKPHPNIIQLYGYSHDKNTKSPIIVLEYCPNGSLEEYRKKHGVVDFKTMTEMLHSIALGLHHLHNANIVHRDLGARNILLNKDVCKISDFGMSGSQKNTHGNSETIVKAMPIPWMAPEVLSVKKSDSGVQVTEFSTKSDVWSFGMVIYELLVGKPPHHEIDRRQEHQLAERIIKEGFTPEIPSDCPDLLHDIMQKCWQKDPAERLTMKEVCAMLKSSSAPNSMTF